ncbi:MAG TPA: FixH family protein [Polyangiaceae bacterium]|nr:FixH family protein [Polyangiaceae bacterium]
MSPQRKPMSATSARLLRGAALLAALGALGVTGCSSDEKTPNPSPTPGDCNGRAEPVTAGMSKLSDQGYTFELEKLEPSVPVQSDSPPGNHWTVVVTDPDGARVTGASLSITSYMPDHGHAGLPAAAVETADGSYDVADLVFSMPTLYTVSLILTLPNGMKQTATLSLCLDVASG